MYLRMAISVLLLATTLAIADDFKWGSRNTSFDPAFPEQFRAPAQQSATELGTRTLADGLEVPWGIATLPSGEGFLVTERAGRLRHVTLDGRVSDPVDGVPEVYSRGQGGLLDVALSPDFDSDRLVYLTYAKPLGWRKSVTAAARGRINEELSALEDVSEIFVQNPPSTTSKHYGSRIVFDEEGYAFITTGEHSSGSERVLAQDLSTTYGKVVRLAPDGTVPADNPFVDTPDALPEIWSYGHRNIQGATVDQAGRLWTIEHGPRGGDELNRPQAGANYGWPVISYGINYIGTDIGEGIAVADGMEQPVYFWDPVIAPAGMSVHRGESFSEWNGDLLIGGLVARAVVRVDIGADGLVQGEERLLSGIGRVRDVEVLEDGSFVVLVEGDTGAVVHVTPGS